jgi:hypothetical protein
MLGGYQKMTKNLVGFQAMFQVEHLKELPMFITCLKLFHWFSLD